jgi:glycine oxidase
MPDRRADVLVVGAGIIGLSIAWRLARRGAQVTILDRAPAGQGASRVAGGMLAPSCEAHEMPAPLIDLAFEAARRWPGFAADLSEATGLDIGYRASGTLWIARDRDELRELDHVAPLQRAHGLPLVELTGAEARRIAPTLHPSLAGGYHAPDDHHVDPEATCAALLAALGVAGATVDTDVDVAAVQPEQASTSVLSTDGRRWQADRVVIAAGAGPHALAPFPLRPVKGQILTLAGEALLDCVVRTPRVYLIPRSDGRLVVGASSEELGYDETPTAGVVMNLLREAWRVLPGVYDLRMQRLGVGLRPALRDASPAIGPLDHPRVVHATGHYRHGVLLAPITADLVVGGMLDGQPWPAAFAPGRFGPARFTPPRA